MNLLKTKTAKIYILDSFNIYPNKSFIKLNLIKSDGKGYAVIVFINYLFKLYREMYHDKSLLLDPNDVEEVMLVAYEILGPRVEKHISVATNEGHPFDVVIKINSHELIENYKPREGSLYTQRLNQTQKETLNSFNPAKKIQVALLHCTNTAYRDMLEAIEKFNIAVEFVEGFDKPRTPSSITDLEEDLVTINALCLDNVLGVFASGGCDFPWTNTLEQREGLDLIINSPIPLASAIGHWHHHYTYERGVAIVATCPYALFSDIYLYKTAA